MPHVEIKCYPGRTEEVKMNCALEVSKVVAQTLGCNESSVTVAIKEIEQADWREKVWIPQIVDEEQYLYKTPGYTCE